MTRSLRGKLFLSYLVVIAIVLTLGLGFLHLSLANQLMDRTAEDLARSARLARRYLVSSAKDEKRISLDPLADEIGRSLRERVTIIAPDGRVLGDSELSLDELARIDNHGARPEVLEARRKGAGRSVRFSKTLGRNMLYLALPIREGPVAGGTVRIAVSLAQIDQTVARMRGLLLAAGGFAFLIALGISLGAAQMAQRAMREIIQAAGAITEGKFAHRIASIRQDELGELAQAMNRLAEEVESRLADLRRERDQLEAILDGMTEGVMVTDSKGKIVLVNSALHDFFSSLPSSGEGLPLESIRETQVQEAIREVLRSREGRLSREVETLGPPPRTFGLHAARFGAGEEKHLVVVFHDFTEIKKLEGIRREFTSNVSHELRTPITAIRAAAETIQQAASSDPEGVQRFASAIERHSHRLSALVDDLLELGRIESNEEHLKPQRTSLRASADAARRVLESVMDGNGVGLEVNVAEGSDQVWADPSALERIFVNLLENAVNYSPRGGAVEVSARASQAGWVEISVTDRGEGIPPEHLPRIFERFYRVDSARSRERGGTGLGLAIVKHLVQGHGGEVSVESTPGKGSIFRFTLPTP